MTRILIIDDEPIYQKMILHALGPLGYELESANDGEQGLQVARVWMPDLIISDVMMPKLSGYGVTRQLRRDPNFAHTPIIILTSRAELQEKIEAFEAGADDHMTKPFEPAELTARVSVLLRRREPVNQPPTQAVPRPQSKARLIAIHSLRGGVGCSSLAINIGISMASLWRAPTLLIDLVLTAGQAALMLNVPLKRTWADISQISPSELDLEALQSITGKHESGLHLIAAPTYPSEAELLTEELTGAAIKILGAQFEYIVVDLPHDFSGATIRVLDAADTIVLLLAPEIASVRAAAAALDTYKKLGYSAEKVQLILNWTFEKKGLPRKNIEAALQRTFAQVLPFAPELCVEAINLGRPLIYYKPQEPISEAIELFASGLSKPEHRSNVPAAAPPSWQPQAKK